MKSHPSRPINCSVGLGCSTAAFCSSLAPAAPTAPRTQEPFVINIPKRTSGVQQQQRPHKALPCRAERRYLVRAGCCRGKPLSSPCSFVLHLFVFMNCLSPPTYKEALSVTRTILYSLCTARSKGSVLFFGFLVFFSRVQPKVAQR